MNVRGLRVRPFDIADGGADCCGAKIEEPMVVLMPLVG